VVEVFRQDQFVLVDHGSLFLFAVTRRKAKNTSTAKARRSQRKSKFFYGDKTSTGFSPTFRRRAVIQNALLEMEPGSSGMNAATHIRLTFALFAPLR
jgi:hypothetical protein